MQQCLSLSLLSHTSHGSVAHVAYLLSTAHTQARVQVEGVAGEEQEVDCPVGVAGAGGRGIMEGDMDPGAAGERGGGDGVGTGVVVSDVGPYSGIYTFRCYFVKGYNLYCYGDMIIVVRSE